MCSGTERQVLKSAKAGVVHCPASNFALKSGVLDVRTMLGEGIKIGLGTDVAGGAASSILDAIRLAIVASRVSHFPPKKDSAAAAEDGSTVPATEPLDYTEAFHLATMGGAEVLGLDTRIGNFLPGKAFDALLIDSTVSDGPFDLVGDETPDQIFEKFLYLGDDRNIAEVGFTHSAPWWRLASTDGFLSWPLVPCFFPGVRGRSSYPRTEGRIADLDPWILSTCLDKVVRENPRPLLRPKTARGAWWKEEVDLLALSTSLHL